MRARSLLFPLLLLVLAIASTGCRSFLRNQVMKDYPVKVRDYAGVHKPNAYQADFLYLKALGEEVVPLRDQYFPPAKREPLEQQLLEKLASSRDHDMFVLSLQAYLSGFNCQHAYIAENPHPSEFSGYYPFSVHYLSNQLFLANVITNYDRSLIGKCIAAINDQPISQVEEKLFAFVSAESLWTKRASLESEPCSYSRPDLYQFAGLSGSVSNQVKIEFTDHSTVSIAPTWQKDLRWHRTPGAPHPITAHSRHPYDRQIFPEQHLAYLQFNSCFDKTAILDGLDMVRPWIRPLVRGWLAWQFNSDRPSAVLDGIYDPSRPLLKEYLADSIHDIQNAGITNLIIDLRYNPGGETSLIKQFLYFLTRRADLVDTREFQYNPDVFAYYSPGEFKEFRAWYVDKFGEEPPSGRLLPSPERAFFHLIEDPASAYFVEPDRPVFEGRIVLLVNQDTGSAASILAGLMQDNHLAVLVGTTTGNNPTGPTGMTPFKLPHSGIIVSLPTEYDERAQPENGVVLQPEYWVEDSLDDLQNGRDAPFEKALQLLDIHSPTVGPWSHTDFQNAIEFLKGLKQAGRQPGWSSGDKGEATLHSFSFFAPESMTFMIRKRWGTDRYFYKVVKTADPEGWYLQEAWRTDRKGRVRQRYQLPPRNL